MKQRYDAKAEWEVNPWDDLNVSISTLLVNLLLNKFPSQQLFILCYKP